MRKCGIGIDIDTLGIVLEAHGLGNRKFREPTFSKILPRFNSFFKERDIRATFFVTGDCLEKKENRKAIQELYSSGHEIASHSFSHPVAFSRLDKRQKEEEIKKAEAAIRECTGERPVGFRAPGWDISEETIQILEKRGYLYDSSVLPTWVSRVFKYYLKFTGANPKIEHPIGRGIYALAPNCPYRPDKNALWKKGKGGIIEIPVSSSPGLRLPLVGTIIFTLGFPYFSVAYSMERLSGRPMNLQLHSVELLDPLLDVESRTLAGIRHAPTTKPLNEKIRLYEKMLSKIAKEREFLTLREIASEAEKSL